MKSIFILLTCMWATSANAHLVKYDIFFDANNIRIFFYGSGVITADTELNAIVGFKVNSTEACQWFSCQRQKDLRDSAVQNGANAVINIKSNYKNALTSSNETFQCGSGMLVAGVALVGDVAILGE